MLPLCNSQPIEFHCKSINQCLFNESTGLKSFETHKNLAGVSSRWGKPFQKDTQPKLNVLKTFISCPRRHMNILCMFNLLCYYRDSTSPQRS